jgi:hypothetical protein
MNSYTVVHYVDKDKNETLWSHLGPVPAVGTTISSRDDIFSGSDLRSSVVQKIESYQNVNWVVESVQYNFQHSAAPRINYELHLHVTVVCVRIKDD